MVDTAVQLALALDNPTEEWRPIPGSVGYEVSSLGRLRSIDRDVSYTTADGRTITRHHQERILKLTAGKKTKYFYASLGRYGGNILVHRAIALAFHGEPPTAKHHAAHDNGDRQDNRPGNVHWKTPVENEADKLRHGRRYQGTDHHLNKLSEDDVRTIRQRLAVGYRIQTALAREYGVDRSTIGKIGERRIWKHLP
jgi:hypothetical protein